MSAWVLANRLSWILDFLAMVSLAGTREVRIEIFVVAGVLFLLSRSRFFKVPEKWVMYGLVALLVSAAGMWFRFRFHPILAASYMAPLVHSFLFFAPETGRYRGWRIGIGFVQMVLAAALAPDFYLFPAIFAFILIGAVGVSSGFLDEELKTRSPEHRAEALPAGFIKQSLFLAFLIFLTSLVIFPILPRMNINAGGADTFKVGYTEQVELSEKKGLNGREGTGEPILRLYSSNGSDLSTEIYLGLLRGRSLDVFDGMNWLASPKRARNLGPQYIKPSELKKAIWVEANRSPIRSSSLPVPYGAIQTQNIAEDSPYSRTVGGEWVDSQSSDSRIRYAFAFFPYQRYLRRLSLDEDPPSSIDLTIPSVLKTTRMERLADSIFTGAKTENEKVDHLLGFFLKERFSAAFADSASSVEFSPGVQKAAYERMQPMERFLFLTKEGHCEWFASSSVVLLRMAGVPSRLVSGFRISKGAVGGVTTLTTNDAHAWVEYWMPNKGWTALDPTPRMMGPSGLLNVFRNGYEWVSAYWYRYVLNFTDSKGGKELRSTIPSFSDHSSSTHPLKSLRDRCQAVLDQYGGILLRMLIALILVLTASGLILKWKYPWIFSIRHRVREGHPSLRRERIRMEKLVLKRTRQADFEQAIEVMKEKQEARLLDGVLQWKETYERLRFGRNNPEELRTGARSLKQQYRKLLAKVP
jgi:transglutaminase-like putative cysteine protease